MLTDAILAVAGLVEFALRAAVFTVLAVSMLGLIIVGTLLDDNNIPLTAMLHPVAWTVLSERQ